MAGFPYHQLDTYLGKLIAAGLRVAICDQVEDPKQAKGLVRRELTRIVTRGTITDDCADRTRARTTFSPRLCRGRLWAWRGSSFRPAAFTPRSSLPIAWPTSWRGSRRSSACWPKMPNRRRTCSPTAWPSRDGPTGSSAQHAGGHEIARQAFRHCHARRFWIQRVRCGRYPRGGAHPRVSPRNAENLHRTRRPADSLPAGERCWKSTRPRAAAWRSVARCAMASATARSWPSDRTVTAMGSRLLSRMGRQPAYRHWRNQRPPRRCGRATGRCGLVHWLARHAHEHLTTSSGCWPA